MMNLFLPASRLCRKMAETKTKKGKQQSVGYTKAWLEEQNAYTLHRPVRKRFARNSYTLTNVMYVWECDLWYVNSYAKYNDNFKNILSVIDVLSKFLYAIPVKIRAHLQSPRPSCPYLTISRNNFRVGTHE